MMVWRESSNRLSTSKMVPCTKENGILPTIRETEEAYKFGLTAQDMTDFGRMAWPVDMVDWCTQKVMSTRALGMKIKPTVSEFTPIITEVGTKVNGSTISSMEKESKSGQTVLNTLASTSRE